MFKKLRIKFVLIVMLSTLAVTGILFGLILYENYRQINSQTDTLIEIIANNDGSFPEYKTAKNYNYDSNFDSNFITQETEYSTRYFTVVLNDSNEVINTNMDYIASVDSSEVDTLLDNVLSEEKESGFYGNYKYAIVQKNNGKLIVFLDCSLQLNNLKSTIKKSIIILCIGYIIILIIVSLLSKKVLEPFINNINKQKQFITNASHELKTPLAVISADVSVLEMEYGENNEWVSNIKNQSNRLNTLVKSLLNLSNFEEGKTKLELTEFSLTTVIKETINDFKALLDNRTIVFDESTGILINADNDSIKQLVAIFLDNAIKYTDSKGTIEITLKKHGKSVIIDFSNTCDNVDKINVNKLFDRFYRDDKSRNKKKEGYGIGLSIAKSIVEMHKGKIKAFINDKKMICFRIII